MQLRSSSCSFFLFQSLFLSPLLGSAYNVNDWTVFARLVCMEFAYLHTIVGLAWAHPRMHTLLTIHLCYGVKVFFVTDFFSEKNPSVLYSHTKHGFLCHIHRLFASNIPLGGTMIGGQVAR